MRRRDLRGRICFNRQKINLRLYSLGRASVSKQAGDEIWLVRPRTHDAFGTPGKEARPPAPSTLTPVDAGRPVASIIDTNSWRMIRSRNGIGSTAHWRASGFASSNPLSMRQQSDLA